MLEEVVLTEGDNLDVHQQLGITDKRMDEIIDIMTLIYTKQIPEALCPCCMQHPRADVVMKYLSGVLDNINEYSFAILLYAEFDNEYRERARKMLNLIQNPGSLDLPPTSLS
jgi:hypothetical protein